MITFLLAFAFLNTQLPARSTEPVVLMLPNHPTIGEDSGGKFVQLKNEPASVYLPAKPPKTMPTTGTAWYVDLVNFGPRAVTVTDNQGFSVLLQPKDIVRIVSDSLKYQVIK